MTDEHRVAGSSTAPADETVTYEQRDAVAIVTINRPGSANAQNDDVTYALDSAFKRASLDDSVRAIVLRSNGKHFSAGHDIGPRTTFAASPEQRVTLWYDTADKQGGERTYAREQEVYLGMCRRWRDLPKPTVAAVQGGCIAGGLMLAWVCDLIIAADDAFFSDPVITMGVPGVEYFAHPFEMAPRIAREFLFLGARMSAARAYEVGMVNRVVPRHALDDEALSVANDLATRPRFALALAKQAFNLVDDMRGKRNAMESVFALHHLAHAHNQITDGKASLNRDVETIKKSMK
jgi:enoyl-CoA hydratase